jgi:hypothetical protein
MVGRWTSTGLHKTIDMRRWEELQLSIPVMYIQLNLARRAAYGLPRR